MATLRPGAGFPGGASTFEELLARNGVDLSSPEGNANYAALTPQVPPRHGMFQELAKSFENRTEDGCSAEHAKSHTQQQFEYQTPNQGIHSDLEASRSNPRSVDSAQFTTPLSTPALAALSDPQSVHTYSGGSTRLDRVHENEGGWLASERDGMPEASSRRPNARSSEPTPPFTSQSDAKAHNAEEAYRLQEEKELLEFEMIEKKLLEEHRMGTVWRGTSEEDGDLEEQGARVYEHQFRGVEARDDRGMYYQSASPGAWTSGDRGVESGGDEAAEAAGGERPSVSVSAFDDGEEWGVVNSGSSDGVVNRGMASLPLPSAKQTGDELGMEAEDEGQLLQHERPFGTHDNIGRAEASADEYEGHDEVEDDVEDEEDDQDGYSPARYSPRGLGPGPGTGMGLDSHPPQPYLAAFGDGDPFEDSGEEADLAEHADSGRWSKSTQGYERSPQADETAELEPLRQQWRLRSEMNSQEQQQPLPDEAAEPQENQAQTLPFAPSKASVPALAVGHQEWHDKREDQGFAADGTTAQANQSKQQQQQQQQQQSTGEAGAEKRAAQASALVMQYFGSIEKRNENAGKGNRSRSGKARVTAAATAARRKVDQAEKAIGSEEDLSRKIAQLGDEIVHYTRDRDRLVAQSQQLLQEQTMMRQDSKNMKERLQKREEEFQKHQKQEIRKLKRERLELDKRTRDLKNAPTRKERDQIDKLQSRLAAFQTTFKSKESRWRLDVERTRRDLATAHQKIEALQEEAKVAERRRTKELETKSRQWQLKEDKLLKLVRELQGQLEQVTQVRQFAVPEEVAKPTSAATLGTPDPAHSNAAASSSRRAATASPGKAKPKTNKVFKSSGTGSPFSTASPPRGTVEARRRSGTTSAAKSSELRRGKDSPALVAGAQGKWGEENEATEGKEGEKKGWQFKGWEEEIGQDKVVKHLNHPGGKREFRFASGSRLLFFANGTEKMSFPSGYSKINFSNGDRKERFPDKRIVYYYAEANTTHLSYPNGLQVYHFGDTQTEKHSPDGSKEIFFSDGTMKVVKPSGESVTTFPDGTVYAGRSSSGSVDASSRGPLSSSSSTLYSSPPSQRSFSSVPALARGASAFTKARTSYSPQSNHTYIHPHSSLGRQQRPGYNGGPSSPPQSHFFSPTRQFSPSSASPLSLHKPEWEGQP